jgi:hypothetical protein
MTDVKGLPEHHRAYIYARAAVLAEDTSTDALDALVRRGFTDAEELRMRDRRYLAANTGTAGGAPGLPIRRPAVRAATHRRDSTARTLKKERGRAGGKERQSVDSAAG